MNDDPIHEYLYCPPSLMDGATDEVAVKTVEQLREITDWVIELTEESSIQLRNSYQTAVLNEAPATNPTDLLEKWEQSDEKAAIDRVQTLFTAVQTALRP
jgi:pyruvate-formate lyase-activating enzyme